MTVKVNGKDIPVIHAKAITTIQNQKTGAVYKDEDERKTLKIPVEDIRRDVLVKIPKLDLFAKTK